MPPVADPEFARWAAGAQRRFRRLGHYRDGWWGAAAQRLATLLGDPANLDVPVLRRLYEHPDEAEAALMAELEGRLLAERGFVEARRAWSSGSGSALVPDLGRLAPHQLHVIYDRRVAP